MVIRCLSSTGHDNQRSIIEILHKKKALRSGLDAADATDILWTLNHPDLYWLLVTERGWTPDQHEAWLADLLCEQILTNTDDAGPRTSR